MLSTNYRLRLEGICKDIASGTEVTMSDMIWAQKLAKANTSARFNGADDIADWFKNDKSDDWRQRD